MIVHLDTSAFIPLLVEEAGSERAARLWDEADHVVSVRLLYAEARAALAQARRLRRISSAGLDAATTALEQLYVQLDLVEIDDALVRHAGTLAEDHGLRGYDAVHLAAAHRLPGPDVVLAAGDGALLAAASRLGLAVAPT